MRGPTGPQSGYALRSTGHFISLREQRTVRAPIRPDRGDQPSSHCVAGIHRSEPGKSRSGAVGSCVTSSASASGCSRAAPKAGFLNLSLQKG
jgi:hypothetical protein